MPGCRDQLGVLDLPGGVGDGTAEVPALGFGDGAGMGGPLAGERAFHLGEQGDEQERDAAHPVGGGVDRDRAGQRPHADAFARQLGVSLGPQTVAEALVSPAAVRELCKSEWSGS